MTPEEKARLANLEVAVSALLDLIDDTRLGVSGSELFYANSQLGGMQRAYIDNQPDPTL